MRWQGSCSYSCSVFWLRLMVLKSETRQMHLTPNEPLAQRQAKQTLDGQAKTGLLRPWTHVGAPACHWQIRTTACLYPARSSVPLHLERGVAPSRVGGLVAGLTLRVHACIDATSSGNLVCATPPVLAHNMRLTMQGGLLVREVVCGTNNSIAEQLQRKSGGSATKFEAKKRPCRTTGPCVGW